MATEQVIEQVAEVAEKAAEHLEEAAVVTRRINPKIIGYSVVGLSVGIVVGFAVGYRWNRSKIRAEAFKQSEKEVEEIREMYRESSESIKIATGKPPLDEVIEERGYGDAIIKEDPRPLPPPVVITPPSVIPPTGPLSREELTKSKNDGWNFPRELASRSSDRPYIIHQDEYGEDREAYSSSVLTWYAGDEVLTDEDEEVMADPDAIVGLENLDKFGHGSDDVRVVFIRNEHLQMEYEVCLVLNSYASEVQGINDDEQPH
jgi:hypothetical protein